MAGCRLHTLGRRGGRQSLYIWRTARGLNDRRAQRCRRVVLTTCHLPQAGTWHPDTPGCPGDRSTRRWFRPVTQRQGWVSQRWGVQRCGALGVRPHPSQSWGLRDPGAVLGALRSFVDAGSSWIAPGPRCCRGAPGRALPL